MSPNTWKAGTVYFGVAFGAGFVLGVIRQIWVVPGIGAPAAELAEMPIMLVVIVVAARWVVARFGIGRSVAPRLAVGLLALALLVVAELTFVLGLRGLTFSEYLSTRDPVAGTAYLVMLGIYALMPALLSLNERYRAGTSR